VTNIQPDGYLALPASGKGSAVLVLHAWWGLNETMKAFCTRLAGSGFVAFAPDLYHGKLADTIEGAEALSNALDPDGARADIAEAVKFLREREGGVGKGIAVIGFSLGAFFALELSVTEPENFKSVVVFYGTRPGDYSGSKAAYLGHFAESDPFEPLPGVKRLEAELRELGYPVEFHYYAGTGHWFFEPDRIQAYNEEAAKLAWERTVAFLKRNS
jgi:carboxymethylenebutenolidase